jgi:hypothetical protein
MLKVLEGKRVTTYSFGNYSVVFRERSPKTAASRLCIVEMLDSSKTPIWRFHYFYGNGFCRLEDLEALNSSTKGTKKAAKELDFLMYCAEKRMKSQGISNPKVRTHKAMARFLHQRGWQRDMTQRIAYDMQKALMGKIFAPSIMGANWRKRRVAARKSIR